MSTLDLKLTFGDETRLLAIPAVADSSTLTWSSLATQVQERFSLDTAPVALSYVDDDGDEITLSSDAELVELLASSAGETTLSLVVVVDKPARPFTAPASPPRSSETVALLDSVRQALEKDVTLVHDLRSIVHDVLPPRPPHHFRRFHHPKHAFAGEGPRRHHGHGHGNREGGRRHRHHRRDETSSSSSSSESEGDSATEKEATLDAEGQEKRHKKHGGRKHHGEKGFKHHHGHHGRDVPYFSPFDGPHRGFAAHPPPPPSDVFAFDLFSGGPRPPPFDGPHQHPHHQHQHRHGKHSGGKHDSGFRYHHGPPPFAFSGPDEGKFLSRPPPAPMHAFGGGRQPYPFPSDAATFFESGEGRHHGRRGHHARF